MNRMVIALLTMVAILGPSLLEAATLKQNRYELKITHNEFRQQLQMKGSIINSKGESKKRILKFLNDNLTKGKDTHIILDLFGGDIAIVNKVYDLISKKCRDGRRTLCSIKTEIEMFRHCASACIPLFMVGDERIAAERSKWGFHQAALIEGFIRIPFMSEYVLRKKGVDSKWLKDYKYMFKTLKMTWLSTDELIGSNIITRLIPHPN